MISLLLCSPSSPGKAQNEIQNSLEREKSLDLAFFSQLFLLVKSFWLVSDGSRVEGQDGDAGGSRTRSGWERGCHVSPHQEMLLQLPSGQQSSVTPLLIINQLGDAFSFNCQDLFLHLVPPEEHPGDDTRSCCCCQMWPGVGWVPSVLPPPPVTQQGWEIFLSTQRVNSQPSRSTEPEKTLHKMLSLLLSSKPSGGA